MKIDRLAQPDNVWWISLSTEDEKDASRLWLIEYQIRKFEKDDAWSSTRLVARSILVKGGSPIYQIFRNFDIFSDFF